MVLNAFYSWSYSFIERRGREEREKGREKGRLDKMLQMIFLLTRTIYEGQVGLEFMTCLVSGFGAIMKSDTDIQDIQICYG